MQDPSFHNKKVYTYMINDYKEANRKMHLFVHVFDPDKIRSMIFHWMDAVPDNEEVRTLLDTVNELMTEYHFTTLLEADPKIPGYEGNRNVRIAATFRLIFSLVEQCWGLFREKEFGKNAFVEYRRVYERLEEFVRSLDVKAVMNSMFDIIKQTLGEELFTSFWKKWEEENAKEWEYQEVVVLKFKEQLFENFNILREFMDVCFFIFNYRGTGSVPPPRFVSPRTKS